MSWIMHDAWVQVIIVGTCPVSGEIEGLRHQNSKPFNMWLLSNFSLKGFLLNFLKDRVLDPTSADPLHMIPPDVTGRFPPRPQTLKTGK